MSRRFLTYDQTLSSPRAGMVEAFAVAFPEPYPGENREWGEPAVLHRGGGGDRLYDEALVFGLRSAGESTNAQRE